MMSSQPGDRLSEDATWQQPRPGYVEPPTEQLDVDRVAAERRRFREAGTGKLPSSALGRSVWRAHFLAYRFDRFLLRAIAIPVAIFLWAALILPWLFLLGVLTVGAVLGTDDPVKTPTAPAEKLVCPDGNGGVTTPDPDTGQCPGG